MTSQWTLLANASELLASLWLREVDESLVTQLAHPPLRQAFADAGGIAPAGDELEDLAVEYCRLFVGPRDHLPPYQSVWQHGELQSKTAVSVEQFSRASGFHAHDDKPTMMDHLGMELAVMAQILRCRANETEDDLKQETEAMIAEFHQRHLRWCKPLTDAVEQRASTEFYRRLAKMTAEFVSIF